MSKKILLFSISNGEKEGAGERREKKGEGERERKIEQIIQGCKIWVKVI